MGSSPAIACRSRTVGISERGRAWALPVRVAHFARETARRLPHLAVPSDVPTVEKTDPDGVDFGWVMQVTFVTTILVGSPLVVLASTAVTLQTWTARALFAVRVGALIWFLTAVCVYLYARYRA